MFEGGASLEAFHAVCNAEGAPAETLLAGIMDRTSLVVVEAGEDGQPRLAMLDTVREFAAEQLGAAPNGRCSSCATRTTSSTYAERAAEEAATRDRRAWLGRLARERGNLRVAFERLLRAGGAEDALRIAIAFARALPWDAHAHEVRGWLRAGARPARARAERAARRGAVLGRAARALAGALRGRRGAARAGAGGGAGAAASRRSRPPR